MPAYPAAITFDGAAGPVCVPGAALASLAGFRAWALSDGFPRSVRPAWVDGEVFVDVSPETIHGHNDVKTALTAALAILARDEDLGEVYADRAMLTHRRARLSCEPDLMFASFETINAGRVRFVATKKRPHAAMEIQGTPDLVVEVLSDSSLRKDDVVLRAAYARAGIPEYWIVDVRGDVLRFDVLALRGSTYRRARKSRAFGRAFDLTRAKNRAGHWTYRLTAR